MVSLHVDSLFVRVIKRSVKQTGNKNALLFFWSSESCVNGCKLYLPGLGCLLFSLVSFKHRKATMLIPYPVKIKSHLKGCEKASEHLKYWMSNYICTSNSLWTWILMSDY